jgi:acetolactate synthase-1/2/3 large subunit
MLVITGNTPSYHHAREPHQGVKLHADASQGDMFRPICKRVWRVDDAKFLADVMPRALNLAQTGRSGAVLIDIPMDVFAGQVDAQPGTVARRPAHWRTTGPADGVADAARLLTTAARPSSSLAMEWLERSVRELKVLAELLELRSRRR